MWHLARFATKKREKTLILRLNESSGKSAQSAISPSVAIGRVTLRVVIEQQNSETADFADVADDPSTNIAPWENKPSGNLRNRRNLRFLFF